MSPRVTPRRSLTRALAPTLALAALLLPACSDSSASSLEAGRAPAARPAGGGVTAAAASDAATLPRVVFLGDSITAGLHLPTQEAFPAVLAELLAADGLPVTVVNAGVSGDTSAGGLSRLDWLLQQRPDVLVVELGGNDGLRGVPLESIEENLRAILRRALDAGVQPVLLGMFLPRNYGLEYTAGFEELYDELAEEFDVPYAPRFMRGVAGDPSLNLGDLLHPNAAGHRKLAEAVLPTLREALLE